MIDNRPLPEIATEDLSFLKKGAVAIGLAALVYLISKLFGGGSSGGGGGGGGGGGSSSSIPPTNTISNNVAEIVKTVGEGGEEVPKPQGGVKPPAPKPSPAPGVEAPVTAEGYALDCVKKIGFTPDQVNALTQNQAWWNFFFKGSTSVCQISDYVTALIHNHALPFHLYITSSKPAVTKARNAFAHVFDTLKTAAPARLQIAEQIELELGKFSDSTDDVIKGLLATLPKTDTEAVIKAMADYKAAFPSSSYTPDSAATSAEIWVDWANAVREVLRVEAIDVQKPQNDNDGDISAAFTGIEDLWKTSVVLAETLEPFSKTNANTAREQVGAQSAYAGDIRDNIKILTHIARACHYATNVLSDKFAAQHVETTLAKAHVHGLKNRRHLFSLAYNEQPFEAGSKVLDRMDKYIAETEADYKDKGFL